MNRQGVSSEHNIIYESLSNDTDSASLNTSIYIYTIYTKVNKLEYKGIQSETIVNWGKGENNLNVGDTCKMAVQNTDR